MTLHADPLQSRIGEVLQEVVFPIERGKIREFALASQNSSPIHFDVEAAARAGFADIPAPLTFTVAMAFYAGGNATDLPLKLGLDLSRVVDGERSWTFHRKAIAGENLKVRTVLSEVSRRTNSAGREMRFITLETTFADQSGVPVITEKGRMIELGRA